MTAHQPTDNMHRRTPLPLTGCFAWMGTAVTIRTNSPAVLQAAVEVGLIARAHADSPAWEIVAEMAAHETDGARTCNAMRNGNTLYLDMGPRQWFAFDSETGNGAGFVAMADSDEIVNQNATHYLRTITAHAVADMLRIESGSRQG